MTPGETEGHGIRLVCLDFQAKPRCEATLSREESLAVATEAFPRSLPVSVREAGAYRALKLFPAGACVGISHAFDGGAVDDWERPVLSARVALVRPGPRTGWGREVAAVAEALSALESEAAGSREGADAVAAHVESAGILLDRDRFAEAVRSAGIPFLSRVARACAVGSDIVLVAEDTPEARRLLTLAAALLPSRRMPGLRACTSCSNVDAEGREEAVFVAKAPPARQGLLSRVTGRPGPDDRIAVDVAARLAPEVRGGPYGPGLFAAALAEVAEGDPWPGLDFPGWHAQVLECLDALWDGRAKELLRDAAAVSKEHAERVREMMKILGG